MSFGARSPARLHVPLPVPGLPGWSLRETERVPVDLSRFRQPRYLLLIAAIIAIAAAPAGIYFANRTPRTAR